MNISVIMRSCGDFPLSACVTSKQDKNKLFLFLFDLYFIYIFFYFFINETTRKRNPPREKTYKEVNEGE